MKDVIFDLDLTLVDSTVAEEARDSRNWPLVYSLIPRFTLYPGIREALGHIREGGGRIAIVSTAPSAYVNRVVSHFNLPVDVVVGYHDAPRKPSPDGMLLAVRRMGSTTANTVSFGDRAIDVRASNAAGITSVGCLWGTKERFLLEASSPSVLIGPPSGILDVI